MRLPNIHGWDLTPLGFWMIGPKQRKGRMSSDLPQDLARILDEQDQAGKPVQYVYIALPISAMDRIVELTNELSTRLAHVCLVPDLFQLDILNSRVTDIGGLPVIHMIDEAPLDFRRAVKRIIDVSFSTLSAGCHFPVASAHRGCR